MPRSVADLYQEHGMTLPELIERTGLEETRLQAIILGRWTPSPLERKKVAAAFEISIEEIAWGHATPIQHLYGHGPG